MARLPSIVTGIRRLLRSTRRHAGQPWTHATRFSRGCRYAFDLIVWSRIARGRRRFSAIELPAELLARKQVGTRSPRLALSGGTETSNAFSAGFSEVYALLFANLQSPGILSRFHHALPGPAFRGVYLWDSAFIAQIWKCWEPEIGAEVLQSVIELRAGDRLQHVVSEFAQSKYTQPPLIAWSAVELGAWMTPDRRKHFFAAIEGPLRRYHEWLCQNRRLPNGLFYWEHPYESGVENAPRFGSRDEKDCRDTRRTAAPDLATYMVLQCRALATIASTLGRPRDAAGFDTRAEELSRLVETILWHEADGLYYDRDMDSGGFLRSRTIASLLPMWAGIPSEARARRLRNAAIDPAAFGTRMPLPSVARDDPAFEKDMWRGPVWINTAYAAIQGLLRYGYHDEAGALAYRLCQGVYHVFAEERWVFEFYDPDAFHSRDLFRKRGNRWKAFTLGSGPQKDFVGWTGLVNTLVVEVLFGLRIDSTTLRLRPRFPEAATDTRFSLEFPGIRLCIELARKASGEVEGELRRGGGTKACFAIAAGETVAFSLHPNPSCVTAI